MPSYALNSELEASIVHLAENLANRSQIGAFCETPNLTAAADASVWAAIGLEEAGFDPDVVIGEAGVQFTETAGLLLARA
jgi:hypothetical protein